MSVSTFSSEALRFALASDAAWTEILALLNATSALSGAEAGYLDGITPGTIAASKVASADANKDAGNFRNLTSINLLAGVNGVGGSAGTVVIRDGGNPGNECNFAYADAMLTDAVTAGTGAVSKALTFSSAGEFAYGSSGTHATDATSGGSCIALYVDPSAATAARYTTLRAESLLSTQSFGTQGAGLYTIRGLAGVKAASTYKGTANQGYLAGVQGKLSMAADSVLGDNASGGIYACAALAQVQFTAGATFGTDVQAYGLWVDNQTGANWPTLSHLLNLTNNGGTIRDVIHVYGNGGKFTNFLTMESMGSVVGTQSGVTTLAANLKIVIDGTPYYIPLCTGTT